MNFKLSTLFFTFLFIISSCTMDKEIPSSFIDGIEKIRAEFAPDKRIAVFSVEYKQENQKWIITAETNLPKAAKSLEELVQQTFSPDSYVLNLNTLPDKELGDSTYALVRISAANLRREPKFSAELVDQAILGTELKLLKKYRGRFLVQTSYDYIGWMSQGSFKKITLEELEKWRSAKKVIVKSNYAQIFSKPNINSTPVSDAVLESVLKQNGTWGNWLKVELPDGKTGYIEKKYTRSYSPISNNPNINRNQLIKKAKTLLGIPYLWGGNSSKAFDCSGFTQTVFKTHGYLLPRDANMQVNLGEELQITPDFKNVLAGDLLFFGSEKRISHVAISLGGPQFIHSSGTVHINSLSENDDNYNEYRKRTLRRIKRVIKD